MANSITLPELLKRLEDEGGKPSEVEEEVKTACKEAQRDIKTTLRDECRLQLRKPEIPMAVAETSSGPAYSGPAYIRIPVKICPGCPAGFKEVKIPLSDEAIKKALLLASHRDDLEKIATGGPGTSQLHEKLLNGCLLNMGDLPSLDPSGIKAVTAWAKACLTLLNETAEIITGRILLVKEYCMGVYRYHRTEEPEQPRRGRGRAADPYCYYQPEEPEQPTPQIELYWAVIGLVAKLCGWTVRDLAIKVLTHEWAHAFTHLGLDIDEGYWPADSFKETDRSVKEGLAQYYTHQTLAILADRSERLYNGAFLVYEELWPKQHAAYRAHRPWLDHYKSEHVRHALLGLRQSGETSLKEFECRLENVKNDWEDKGAYIQQ